MRYEAALSSAIGATMRPAVIIVIAVIIAAIFAVDAYEFDGHYRTAAEHQVEQWLGYDTH